MIDKHTVKQNKGYRLAVRLPFHQINKLESRAVQQNKNLSEILREILEALPLHL